MTITSEMLTVLLAAGTAVVAVVVYVWQMHKSDLKEDLAGKASAESVNKLTGIVESLSDNVREVTKDVRAATESNHATDVMLGEIRLQVGRCVSHLESEQEWRKDVHERQTRLEVSWLREMSLLRQSLDHYGRRPGDKTTGES